MNKINIPKKYISQIFNDPEYRFTEFTDFLQHSMKRKMIEEGNYPFESGYIEMDGKFLLHFQVVLYKDDCSKDYNPAFVVTAHNKEHKYYRVVVGIHSLDEGYDLFLEQMNDENEYSKNGVELCSSFPKGKDLTILFAMKLIIQILKVSYSALNARKEIIAIESHEKRKFKNGMNNKQIAKKIILQDGIVYTHIYDDKRPYNRHIEAWEVRGHYRHYKSGKTVFIKPFRKGTGDIYDKEYDATV